MSDFFNCATSEKIGPAVPAQRTTAMVNMIDKFGLSEHARIVAMVLADQADAAGIVSTSPWLLAPVAEISPKEACKALIELEWHDVVERQFGGSERYKILLGWRVASV